jgi:hypothetical protein
MRLRRFALASLNASDKFPRLSAVSLKRRSTYDYSRRDCSGTCPWGARHDQNRQRLTWDGQQGGTRKAEPPLLPRHGRTPTITRKQLPIGEIGDPPSRSVCHDNRVSRRGDPLRIAWSTCDCVEVHGSCGDWCVRSVRCVRICCAVASGRQQRRRIAEHTVRIRETPCTVVVHRDIEVVLALLQCLVLHIPRNMEMFG